jgi:hypothetical protein
LEFPDYKRDSPNDRPHNHQREHVTPHGRDGIILLRHIAQIHRLTIVQIHKLILDQRQKKIPTEARHFKRPEPPRDVLVFQQKPSQHRKRIYNQRNLQNSSLGIAPHDGQQYAPTLSNPMRDKAIPFKIKKLPDHDENRQIFPRMKIHIANKKHCKSLEQIESQVHWQIHKKGDQKTCFHFVESCL